MPGVPSIYYGSEYGIKAVKGDKTDLPLRPSVDEIENYEDKNNELFDHIEKLGRIRVVSEALKNGNYEQVIIKNEQYVFSRTSKNDKIYIVLNLSDKESYLDFNISFEEGKDLLSDKDDIIKGGDVSIRVPAFSSKVIAKIK